MAEPGSPRWFLEELFAGKPEDRYILIWTLQDKLSRWCRSVADATAVVEACRHMDVYTGVGLSPQDFGPHQRCPAEAIAGLAGQWADFDIRSDAHPNKALPPTIPEALSIIPASMPPTLVLATGNGAQAWWLYKEPHIFETAEERQDAAALAARWQTSLRVAAANRGWAFDRLSDLPRVLRVAGTKNFKDPANPKPVEIFSLAGQRYNPSDFDDFLDDLGIPGPEAEARDTKEWAERFKDRPLVINLNAQVPDEMLRQWAEADMRFRNTWARQRHDLRDQSQSGYDLALACFGSEAGLSEQQVVDLIIHHRSIHKQKHRTRLDYFQRTLTRAARRTGGTDPFAVLAGASTPADGTPSNPEAPVTTGPAAPQVAPSAPPEEASREITTPDPAIAKALLCEQISRVLGIRVVRLVKITGKEPQYRMELVQGKIEFPSFAKFTDQTAVRNAIGALIDKIIPKVKPKAWEQLAQMMLDACIVEEGSEEMEWEGAARMYVAQYLSETAFIPSIEGQTIQSQRKPTVLDEKIAICASDLQTYVNKTTFQNLSVKAVAGMLSALGARSIRVRGQKFKEQSRWVLPVDELDPAEYASGLPQEDANGR
jgi:hypothetical protein